MESKLVTKLSKDERSLMKSTMYIFSSSIFTSMERNWSLSTFTMLMCKTSAPLFAFWWWRTSFKETTCFPMVLASCTQQNVSQALLTFLLYWMCAFVRCSQSNANALVAFSLYLPFHLHHGELLHSHQRTSKAHAWKALCASWTSKGESYHHQTFSWLSKTPFGKKIFCFNINSKINTLCLFIQMKLQVGKLQFENLLMLEDLVWNLSRSIAICHKTKP